MPGDISPSIQLTDTQATPSNEPQLTVEYVAKAGWESFKFWWIKLLKIQIIALLVAVAVAASIFTIMAFASGGLAPLGLAAIFPALVALIPVIVVGMVLLAAWVELAQYLTLGDQSLQPMSEARKRMWGMAGVILLVGLATLGGFILLIIPGIILAVWFSQAAFIYALENIGGTDALRKSREYIRGRWWKVLGFLALPSIVAWVASAPLQMISSAIPGDFGKVIFAILAVAFQVTVGLYTTCYAYHLYLALRATAQQASTI
jgi:hypothetical protein